MAISIITCSVKPEMCTQMLESVKNTIGTDYEAIVFDNREKNLGICQVYNDCAKKAKNPYLCFIHEDVLMPSSNWGKNMIEFAEKTPNCGVIGFAGGTIATRNFTGWGMGPKARYRYYDPSGIGEEKTKSINGLVLKYNNPKNQEFARVVTLDGLFLFVSKTVWEENPFDEENIKGFHFYGTDFSFGVAQKHQNYVCFIADIYHFSGGNRERAFYENARVFQNKWRNALPYSIGEQKITFMDELKNSQRLFVQSVQFGLPIASSIKHLVKINGVLFFFIFCILVPVWSGKKLLKKMNFPIAFTSV